MFASNISLKFVLTLLVFGKLSFRHLKEQWGCEEYVRSNFRLTLRYPEKFWNQCGILDILQKEAYCLVCSTMWLRFQTPQTSPELSLPSHGFPGQNSLEWIAASLARTTLSSRKFLSFSSKPISCLQYQERIAFYILY